METLRLLRVPSPLSPAHSPILPLTPTFPGLQCRTVTWAGGFELFVLPLLLFIIRYRWQNQKRNSLALENLFSSSLVVYANFSTDLGPLLQLLFRPNQANLCI